MSIIVKNTIVTINYTVSDLEGNLLEESEEPVSYLHGDYDNIFPLVEQALSGKQVGDTVDIKLEPADAFGDYDEALVRVEERSLFPDTLEVGMQFVGAPAEEESDGEMLYTVTDVANDKVVVDGNHPLAGEAVLFHCVVTDVRAASPEELSHGHAHGAHGHHH
jgi:FKBP-type peptidyl-prolyl cis-trans isomerase SlyD